MTSAVGFIRNIFVVWVLQKLLRLSSLQKYFLLTSRLGTSDFLYYRTIDKSPKFSKCCRFGLVESACNKDTCCTRCGSSHVASACEAERPLCPNCRQTHESTSPRCPVYRREQAIYRHKSEIGTGYLPAKTTVLSAKGPSTNATTAPKLAMSANLSTPLSFLISQIVLFLRNQALVIDAWYTQENARRSVTTPIHQPRREGNLSRVRGNHLRPLMSYVRPCLEQAYFNS